MKLVSKKLTLVAFLAIVGSIACQDCFTGIKKWAQCKYLTSFMVPGKDGVYVQNPIFPVDVITDDFIQALNLTVKYPNFTSAMNFFRNTFYFKNIKKNKCFYNKFFDQRGTYSIIFSNTNFFNDALEILTNFSREYPTRLSSPKGTTLEYWNKFGANNLPTLRDFCMKNDFTSNVYDFYSSRDPLCNIVDDNYEEDYYSCVYDTIVNNAKRTVTTSPSKTQLTRLAKCSIRPLSGCNSTVTNLFSLFDFTDYWPQLPISPKIKRGMINYFADLVKEPPVLSRNFSYLHAEWSASYLSVQTPTGEQDGYGLYCNSTHVDLIFNSSSITITGTWSNCKLTNITIVTKFPGNTSPKDVGTQKFSIASPNFKQNNKYIKDPTNKKNWLFVRVSKNGTGVNQTRINDLQANVTLYFDSNSIYMFVEKSQLANAFGILVDGFDPEDFVSMGRKKREVTDADVSACRDECRSRKRRWAGPVLDDEKGISFGGSAANEGDFNSHVVDQIIAPSQCVRECLRR